MSVWGDCAVFNDRCRKKIDEALDSAADLLKKMDKDGIAHVIYMGPFYLDGEGKKLKKAIDYGANRLYKICELEAKVDCHVAETRDLKLPKGEDGVHPTPEGYKMLAKRIWEAKLLFHVPIA